MANGFSVGVGVGVTVGVAGGVLVGVAVSVGVVVFVGAIVGVEAACAIAIDCGGWLLHAAISMSKKNAAPSRATDLSLFIQFPLIYGPANCQTYSIGLPTPPLQTAPGSGVCGPCS